MGLCSTVVLRRKFDPEATLSLTAQHECTGARRRAGDAPADPRARRRGPAAATTCRRCRPCPSSRLRAARGSLSDRWMDLFGENLYNLYGSTEVAWATIATPAGPARRARHRRPAAARHRRPALRRGRRARSRAGETGRIFVGNEIAFEGYTGGGGKDVIDGPAVLGRRRPLRRGRAPVHRRPRRRHDRLGRRERLPGRGRGAARRATRRSPRWPSSASTDEQFGQRLEAVVVRARRQRR